MVGYCGVFAGIAGNNEVFKSNPHIGKMIYQVPEGGSWYLNLSIYFLKPSDFPQFPQNNPQTHIVLFYQLPNAENPIMSCFLYFFLLEKIEKKDKS